LLFGIVIAENVVQRTSISSDAAARGFAAAVAEANKTSVPVTAVVVDESGSLKEMRCLEHWFEVARVALDRGDRDNPTQHSWWRVGQRSRH
jgi:hypothetical protein